VFCNAAEKATIDILTSNDQGRIQLVRVGRGDFSTIC